MCRNSHSLVVKYVHLESELKDEAMDVPDVYDVNRMQKVDEKTDYAFGGIKNSRGSVFRPYYLQVQVKWNSFIYIHY